MKLAWKALSGLIFNSRRSKFLWGAFVAALLLRLAIVVAVGDTKHPLLYEHGDIAHNLYTGHGFAMHWPYASFDSQRRVVMALPPDHEGAFIPPINPYLIYIAYSIFGESPQAILYLMLFYSILSALIVLIVYHTGRQLGTERGARVATLLTIFFLPGAYAVVTFSGSVLYQLLGVIIFYVLIKLIRKRLFTIGIVAGLCCGLMALLRSEFLMLGFLLLIGATMIPFKKRTIKHQLGLFFSSVLAFSAVVTPWTIRNYNVSGHFIPVLSHPWYEIWRGNNPLATGDGATLWVNPKDFPSIVHEMDAVAYDAEFEFRVNQIFKREVFSYWSTQPGRGFLVGLKKVFYLFTVDFSTSSATNPAIMIMTIGAIGMLCLGYIRLSRSSLTTEKIIILLFGGFYIILTFFTFMLPRYQIYLIQVLMPLTAVIAGTTTGTLKPENEKLFPTLL